MASAVSGSASGSAVENVMPMKTRKTTWDAAFAKSKSGPCSFTFIFRCVGARGAAYSWPIAIFAIGSMISVADLVTEYEMTSVKIWSPPVK